APGPRDLQNHPAADVGGHGGAAGRAERADGAAVGGARLRAADRARRPLGPRGRATGRARGSARLPRRGVDPVALGVARPAVLVVDDARRRGLDARAYWRGALVVADDRLVDRVGPELHRARLVQAYDLELVHGVLLSLSPQFRAAGAASARWCAPQAVAGLGPRRTRRAYEAGMTSCGPYDAHRRDRQGEGAGARRRRRRHRRRGRPRRAPSGSGTPTDSAAHLAGHPELCRVLQAHPRRRLPRARQRVHPSRGPAGAARDGPRRLPDRALPRGARPLGVSDSGPGDRLGDEERQLRLSLDAPRGDRGGPRHDRPRAESPHEGSGAALLHDGRPHRRRARARRQAHRAALHRRALPSLPLLLPARRRRALGARQAPVRDVRPGVRLLHHRPRLRRARARRRRGREARGARRPRVVWHLAGVAACRRRLRRLPALSRGLPRGRRLQSVPERSAARDPGEDRRESRAGTRAARDPPARRAGARHGRRARPLDRRGRLPASRAARRHARVSLTADAVKAKARALGADLVGIAHGGVLDRHPPDPARPQTPARITSDDSKSVIVLARRLLTGINRLRGHDDRHKQYSTELVLTDLEEIELKLVYFLEDAGFPSITVPPVHFDPRHYDPKGDTRGPLSLAHAAVEAGLGTL